MYLFSLLVILSTLTAGSLAAGQVCKDQLNVFGKPLEPCSRVGIDPVAGWHRDGCARTEENDTGTHVICAVMTQEVRGKVLPSFRN